MDNGTTLWVSRWHQWRKWIGGTAEDVLITDFKSANKPTSDLIDCNGFSAIQMLPLGQDAEDEEAQLRISGWMDNGPGCLLWDGTIKLGASSVATETFDGWVASGTWYHADTFTATTNTASAEAFTSTDNQGFLTVPTHGYKSLYIEAQGKDGSTSVQALSIVTFWRPQVAVISI